MKSIRESQASFFEAILWNQKVTGITTRLLLATMMACVSVPVMLIGRRLFPAYDSLYLIPACFIIALEAMVAAGKLRNLVFTDRKWIAYRVSEWIVILILMKLIIYGWNGFNRLWADLPGLANDFLGTFFSPDYFIAIGILFIIWLIATDMGGMLLLLEDDDQILKIEEDRGFSEQRYLVRDQFGKFIISMGIAMICLTSLVRLDSGGLWGNTSAVRGGVLAILIFFTCGLILLSLTQFSVMRVRWILNHVPIQKRLAGGWVLYSLICLLSLLFIAFVLPTSYSRGFLSVLQNGIGVIFNILQAVINFILMPFILFIGWIISLLSQEQSKAYPEPVSQVELEPIKIVTTPIPWLEALKTFLFWGILVGLIFFSFVYYFREHPEYIAWIRRLGIIRDFRTFIRNLLLGLQKFRKNIAIVLDDRLSRLRGSGVSRTPGDGKKNKSVRNLSTREQVMFYYLMLIRRGGESGIPRQPAQTPAEYAKILTTSLTQPSGNYPDQLNGNKETTVRDDITWMTEAFVEAKYSRHDVSASRVNVVKQSWNHIHALLKKWNNKRTV